MKTSSLLSQSPLPSLLPLGALCLASLGGCDASPSDQDQAKSTSGNPSASDNNGDSASEDASTSAQRDAIGEGVDAAAGSEGCAYGL